MAIKSSYQTFVLAFSLAWASFAELRPACAIPAFTPISAVSQETSS